MADLIDTSSVAHSIQQAMELFLDSLRNSSSDKTIRTYRTALNTFCAMLAQQELDAHTAAPGTLGVQHVEAFIAYLEDKSPATEKLYLAAVRSYYAFLEDEGLASPNLGKIQRRIHNRARKAHWAPEIFPREGIEKVIGYAQALATKSVEGEGARLKSEDAIRTARRQARLRNLRDRALILVLADTGLRVAEACSLTYGQVDALEARLRGVQRKGYKRKGIQKGSTVLVSERALAAIRDYQAARKEAGQPSEADLPPSSGLGPGGGRKARQPAAGAPPPGMKRKSVPLFIRHDPGAGAGGLKRLTEKSAWEIVKGRAKEVLGEDGAEQIHPHSFRHYFVTMVLLDSDLETARRLAGHASADTTSRYAEIDPEVEERYHRIFNEKR